MTGEMMYTVRLLYKIAGNPGYGQGDILNSRTLQSAIAFVLLQRVLTKRRSE